MVVRGTMANRKDDEQEMSMEEILASIRKYVTEDDPQHPSAMSPSSTNSPYAPTSQFTPKEDSQGNDDDILDLKHIHTMMERPLAVNTPPLQDIPANDMAPIDNSEHHSSDAPKNKIEIKMPSQSKESLPENTESQPTTPSSSEQGKELNVSQLASPTTLSVSAQSLSHLVTSTKAAQEQAAQEAAHLGSGQTL